MHHNKGSEIMGLAIAMILITIGILFATVFLMKQSDEKFNIILDQELASNTLSSILQTTTNCNGQTIENLIIDCAGERRFLCSGSYSCDFVRNELKVLLDRTLSAQKRNYFLNFKTSDEIFFFGEKCQSQQTSSTAQIPVYGELISVRLDLCR